MSNNICGCLKKMFGAPMVFSNGKVVLFYLTN